MKASLPGMPDKADSLARLLIESAPEQDDSVLALGWFYRAEAAYYSGKFERACNFYERTDELLDSIEQPGRKATVLNNLGLTHYFKERYNEALDAFIRSADIEQSLDNQHGFAQCLHNIALVHDKAGRRNSAETYFDHALDQFLDMDSLAAAAAVYNDYAIYYSGYDDNESAIEMYSKALDIFKQTNDSAGIAKVKCNIGALHLYEKNYRKAASFLEKALDYFKEKNDQANLINVYSLLGDLYYEQDRSALSVVFYERAENMAGKTGQDHVRQKNLYSLFKALKAEEEFEQALNVLETYSHLKDSLIAANEGFIENSADHELESELNERELDLVRAEIKEKNLMLIIAGLLLGLGIVGWFLYLRNKKLKNEREKQLLLQKGTRAQTNPHFIFNALASLQSYVIEENKDEALDYLSDIALLFRKLLDAGEHEFITLEEELDLMDKYLKVQCRRYYRSINCGVSSRIISGSKFLMVPPMLIRPFVDLAFSINNAGNYSWPGIHITYEQKSDSLEVNMKNEGGVIRNEIEANGKEALEERLDLLKRTYKGGKSQVEVIDLYENGTLSGTRLCFSLPLITIDR
ncbi:MAG: tetratricopeptide repeat protein [Marinilabilia sp.]